MPSVTRMGSKLKIHIKCLLLDAFWNKKILFLLKHPKSISNSANGVQKP